jgi:hypothetical protein
MRSRCRGYSAALRDPHKKTSVATYFGFTDLLITQGLVLRFRREFPSLGVVASRIMAAAPSHDDTGHVAASADQVCETLLDRGIDAVEHLRKSYASIKAAPVPVNLRFTSDLEAPDVVFFGGAYDLRDRYWTMRGETEGVRLHAAIYHSKSIRALNHLQLYLLEIGIGTVLGFLLHWRWAAYGRQQRMVAEQWAEGRGRGLSAAAQWLRLRALGLLPLATALLTFFFLMLAVSRLFDSGFWVNPGALVAGIFVDSLHSGRAAAVDHSPPVVQRFDLLWQVPLWLVALGIVSQH